jgi:NAD(P)-dependent dehydrogenase (short-subunit alcohol dehydrogenase family)
MMEFEGRQALVTGSTSGIGFGVALAFFQKGASVYINGRSKERVECAIKKLKEESVGKERLGKLFPCVGDVSTQEGFDIIYPQSFSDVIECKCILKI